MSPVSCQTQQVRLVHHVSESACGDCKLGWMTEEECKQHVCPRCCMKVVDCREQAKEIIRKYREAKQR